MFEVEAYSKIPFEYKMKFIFTIDFRIHPRILINIAFTYFPTGYLDRAKTIALFCPQNPYIQLIFSSVLNFSASRVKGRSLSNGLEYI